MSQPQIPAALRTAVRLRAGGRCEYCRMPETGAFFAHEADTCTCSIILPSG